MAYMECKKSDKIIDMECKPDEVYKLFKKKSLWKKDLIQEKTGYCWLIAVLNCISVYMKKKNRDANYTFSVRNLIIYDKLEKANFFLEQVYETRNEPINSRSVIYVLANAMTDKGNWRMAVNLIEKYGLLPVDDVDKCQIMRTANLNAIVSYLLKSYAYVIREKYKEMTYAEFNTLKEEVISEVRNIIFSYWGEPINSVTLYDGIGNRIYLTQLEFYYKYVCFPFDEYICIMSNGVESKMYLHEIALDQNVYNAPKQQLLNVGDKIFLNAINTQVENGDVCWIGIDAGKFLFKDYGIYDDGPFGIIEENILHSNDIKKILYDYKIASPSHAVTLFDISSSQNGIWWRVQNNIINEYTNNANFYMSESWVMKYVFIAAVKKKYLQLDYENMMIKQTMPWDYFKIS